MIRVTKPFLPLIEEYTEYLKGIWDRNYLTNQGPLLKELENKLEDYLKVKDVHFVANGTLALQLALSALDITEGEIITTPFSYVATTSVILWERCDPVYVDIDPQTLCIDPDKIEAAITDKTKAILAVHVYGNPCDVEKIEAIAKKHNLKVIYDAAHAFGVTYKGKSLLSFGDISTCSFHSTKVFHTVEGGCVVTKDKALSDKIELTKRFGHQGDEHSMIGINAKASEFHAAMGLANLPYIKENIKLRKVISDTYDKLLGDRIERPTRNKKTVHNYAYYPVIFKSEKKMLSAISKLESVGIYPRRYFYPSLNTLSYVPGGQSCPVSEDITSRILCLPIYPGLEEEVIKKISEIV